MTPEVSAPVVELVGACLAELVPEADADAAVAELDALLAGPWRRYAEDPGTHASSLTDSGAPFELSVKLDPGRASLRYVVDVRNATEGLAGNLATYVEAATRLTGLPAPTVRQLLGCHLDDAPEDTPATVMLGRGWAAGRPPRSTVYVPAPWLDGATLSERLPAPLEHAEPAQVVGYDVGSAALEGWKTYHWLPGDLGRTGDGPALVVAGQFVDGLRPGVLPRSGFVQRRFGPDGRPGAERLFFFADPWGWGSPAGLAGLLRVLVERLGVDLAPVRTIRELAARHGVPMHVGLVSVGGVTDAASVTLYLWPDRDGAATVAQLRDI